MDIGFDVEKDSDLFKVIRLGKGNVNWEFRSVLVFKIKFLTFLFFDKR